MIYQIGMITSYNNVYGNGFGNGVASIEKNKTKLKKT